MLHPMFEVASHVRSYTHVRSCISCLKLHLMSEAISHVSSNLRSSFFSRYIRRSIWNIFKQLSRENRDCIPTVFSFSITFRAVFIVCKTVIYAFWRFGVFKNVLLTSSLFALLVINLLIHSGNFIFNSLPYNPAPLNRGKKTRQTAFWG